MNLAMKWIDEVRGADSLREVARRARVHQATLSRQINLDQLTFESVRDIARAYERPVLADLIATGHLAPSDAGVGDIDTALRAASDEQVVLEIGRRLGVVELSPLFDAPISEAVERAGEVIHAPFGVGASSEDEPTMKQPPARQADAAKNGTRKADSAEHAD
ncbi:hypothetical protein [Microbacterium sp. NPDC058389]|uniref:hypothetical protein n=1 Tax=Microbacterium sp. NPDC058389 TaxID=3346475 RepID=UPI00364DF522